MLAGVMQCHERMGMVSSPGKMSSVPSWTVALPHLAEFPPTEAHPAAKIATVAATEHNTLFFHDRILPLHQSSKQ